MNREKTWSRDSDQDVRTIRLADHAGFCFGVKTAIDRTCETVERFRDTGKKISTFGPIIHNRDVIRDLESRGVGIVETPDEVDADSVIIVRSHGISKSEFETLNRLAAEVVDATCPYVKHIHTLVEAACQSGKQIVIIGDASHPEVRGINGWCDDSAMIIEDVRGVEALKQVSPEKTFFVVAQTTLNTKNWDACAEAIRAVSGQAELNQTICLATQRRQDACRLLARQSDAMVIIGSPTSSNSRKLFEIAGEECDHSFFVENEQDLPLKEISKYNRIGVSAGASAPERIIKEVIAKMSEVITNNPAEVNDMEAFMPEIEKSLKTPQRGEIVTGEVIQVSPREIFVNLGCKKDGIIPRGEIALEPDQEIESVYKVGDTVEAKVLKNGGQDDYILLSRKKVEISKHWKEIIEAYDEKQTLEVKVVREVKGGVIAMYKEVSGFIPMSQLNDRYVEKADEFIGKTLSVKVTRVDQRRNKAVFSHKALLAEEKAKRVGEIWASLNVGDFIDGTVMRFTDYGAFVDIGGIDGLLHISEISWGKLKHPKEALEIGQKVHVKILSLNQEKGKISLGLKQNTPEPWSVIREKYSVGQIIDGKVVQIKEYGAFVELEPGLDGLVHISEIAAKRVNNINDEVSIGQAVRAKILEIDVDRRRISLSMKEALSEMPEAEEPEVPEEIAEPVQDDVVETAPVGEAVEAVAQEAEETPVEE